MQYPARPVSSLACSLQCVISNLQGPSSNKVVLLLLCRTACALCAGVLQTARNSMSHPRSDANTPARNIL